MDRGTWEVCSVLQVHVVVRRISLITLHVSPHIANVPTKSQSDSYLY